VAENVSDQLAGTVHANAVDLLRVEAAERQRILALLDQLEQDLVAAIRKNVGKSAITTARLEALLAQTKDTIATAYGDMSNSNLEALGNVTYASAYSIGNAINAAVGVDVASVAFTKAQLTNLANETYFMGRHLEEYWSGAGEKLYTNFTTQMRLGMLQGEGVPELTQRVVGTQANNYADGLMNVPRYQAEALVRTGVVGAANAGRTATYTENADLLNGIQWVATLDDRVCPECEALDGLAWDLPESGDAEDYAGFIPQDHNQDYPGPTAHVSCRCAQIPIVKSYQQMQDENAISDAEAEEIDPDTQDALDGEPSQLGFEDWLNAQPPDVQDETLGATQAELWRDGKLELGDLIDQSNRPLTTDELLAKAGVPPTEATATSNPLLTDDIIKVVFNPSSGANDSYLLTFDGGNRAVFKPDAGESAAFRQFMGGPSVVSLATREVAVSDLAAMMGMDDLVPPTVMRDVDVPAIGSKPARTMKGSVQQFVADSKTGMNFTEKARFGTVAGDVERSAAFDYVIGNTDRHGNNYMVNELTGKMSLIDNGGVLPQRLSLFNSRFFDEAWDKGLKIPAVVRDWLDKWDDIAGYLKAQGFNPREIEGAHARLEQLNKFDTFKAMRLAEPIAGS
jgi:hypothetical protein